MDVNFKDYYTCDYCHRTGNGITIVNGFKMCPMCLAEYEQKNKDQRIAELEKENWQLKKDFAISCAFNEELKQKAVKEFIDFAIEKFSEVDDLGDFKYYLDNAEFKYVIKDLLKERGIE